MELSQLRRQVAELPEHGNSTLLAERAEVGSSLGTFPNCDLVVVQLRCVTNSMDPRVMYQNARVVGESAPSVMLRMMDDIKVVGTPVVTPESGRRASPYWADFEVFDWDATTWRPKSGGWRLFHDWPEMDEAVAEACKQCERPYVFTITVGHREGQLDPRCYFE